MIYMNKLVMKIIDGIKRNKVCRVRYKKRRIGFNKPIIMTIEDIREIYIDWETGYVEIKGERIRQRDIIECVYI